MTERQTDRRSRGASHLIEIKANNCTLYRVHQWLDFHMYIWYGSVLVLHTHLYFFYFASFLSVNFIPFSETRYKLIPGIKLFFSL